MRLTLRTLLAYLDDILEPQDSEDLRKKIDESRFATELVQRTRDCVRRLRLPAPPLTGRGLAGDANSVAEYLDNTLPAERVADFEKICLESDSHLAEVAACHQILTLVLGEPADVDPAGRERMYEVINRSETDEQQTVVPKSPPVGAETKAPPVAPSKASAATAAAAPRRSKPEVPDYLRESRPRFWPVAAVLLIAALLTSGVLALVAPPAWRETAANVFHRGAEDKPADGQQAVPPVAKPEPSAERPEATEPAARIAPGDRKEGEPQTEAMPAESAAKPAATDVAVPTPAGAEGTPPAPEKTPASAPTVQFPRTEASDGDNPLAPLPPDPLGSPRRRPGEEAGTRPAGPDMPLEPGAGKPGPAGTLPGVPVTPAAPEGTPPGPAAAGPGGVAAPAGVAPAPAAAPATAPTEGAPAEGGGEGVGRYLSRQDVLLRFDPASSSWRRLPARANLVSSDHLLSLPMFRPTLTLITGVSVQPVGATSLDLLGLDAQGVPGISVEFGRVVLVTIGRAGNVIRLRLGDRTGTVTFLDAESALALDVQQLLVPGKDPESEPAQQTIELYATSGGFRWEENGQAVEVKAPAGRRLSPLPVEELNGAEQPKWISADNLTPIDQRAASALEHEIKYDRPVALSLMELAENRRVEVRTLAVRCSAYVGQFEPFVAALNDADQRTEWPHHIEALKAAMARGPQVAAQVRQAFEKHRGGEAEELYRMLWGYSPEDLKDGAAAKLVEYLNHDSLDFRVLSFWNLQNITGLTLFYRPESPPAKRRPQYLKWKERLKDGKILAGGAGK